MATMLCTLTTDAAIGAPALRDLLREAADCSFHCISVDGDTSTNDTLLALANGLAGNPPIAHADEPDARALLEALVEVCQYLAQEVVRDGEGARHFVTIHVRGAASNTEAHRAAMNVARSPLVKTALHGADPNWGRVVCALGSSGIAMDPARVVLHFGDIKVFEGALPLPFDEEIAHRYLAETDVTIDIALGMGSGAATVWTCDFSCDYVKINADYRT